ncbi:uncharacterized protein LOC134210846 isoform X1 [Armigeres subalbatus]|uniref:uncharacterized protein LOC134210846 isoform X1 n=1 Tax=Armigeres subalbatus TaxID=124917 RepID=UPI002ED0ABB6
MRAEKRNMGSSAAIILLISVGLAGEIFAFSQVKRDEGEVSAAQRYFDTVAPEDKEAFLKYYLDKALEERIPGHVSLTPAAFSFIIYQDSESPSTAPPSTTATTQPPEEAPDLGSNVELALDAKYPNNYVKYWLVCYSSGCLDPTDIANICCPF